VTLPATTAPATTAPAPAGTPATAPAATAPPAPPEPPATSPGGSIPGETVTLPAATPSGDTAPPAADAASGDDDDDEDWPTRYSWLEDETDDDAVTGTGTAVADAGEVDEAGHEDEAGEAAEDEAESGHEAEVLDLASARERADAEPEPETAEPETAEPETAEPETAELEPEAAESPGLAAVPDHDAADAGTPAGAGDPAAETGLVTVVRGVPRYHQPDCVLIRFMSDGDVQKLSVPEATAAGCTPCTACQD
jgi:hypothetical protein